MSAALVSAKHFDNGRWPLRLIAAAFGKAAVTHTLLWTPLLIVAALAIFKIRRGRIRSTPIPELFAVFVVLVAVVVVPADLNLATRLGQSAIRYGDERVRELIGMFEQRGMLENTLVVIVSDHGEYRDTHGLWSHRFLAYNDLTHMVLMIREPGRIAGLRIDTPVQPSDLFSTILQFAGSTFDRPSPYVSRELLALAERGCQDRIVISECKSFPDKIKKNIDPVNSHLFTPQVTAQDGRFK